MVERTVVRLREGVAGRYVRYRCTSWYGDSCVLQYIEVIQDSGFLSWLMIFLSLCSVFKLIVDVVLTRVSGQFYHVLACGLEVT